MASQVCSRCRKRKIRCDLQLPSCGNCRIADVECLFWDDSLRQEIPCAYLHSLRQKVGSLRLELQHAADINSAGLAAPSEDTALAQHVEHGYHLSNFDPGHTPSPSRMTYLGPGSSARLLEHLMKVTIEWHLAKDVPIPKRLLSDELHGITGAHISTSQNSYQIGQDQRKVELHCLVPLSTQRAIIQHYLKTVSPEYDLLPEEWQTSLAELENPLKWSSATKDHSNALSISIIFAISTALVSRDLDPNLSSIAMRCREEVARMTRRDVLAGDVLEAKKWMCRALCALAICELIRPTSGQLWDLLGRAASTMEIIHEGYQVRGFSLDASYQGMERSLLKLECLTALHFRRPFQCHTRQLGTILANTPDLSLLSDEFSVLRQWNDIAFAFTIYPRPSEQFLESLIPLPLQVNLVPSDIPIHSATLYVALHPLFTTLDIFSKPPSRLFHVVACSARAVIDHFARVNERNMIISVWMAAERVLEAGLVWAAYLMSQRSASPTGEHCFVSMGTNVAMSAIMKVSTLLTSFAARWQSGSSFVDAWETFIELVWNTL